MAEPIPADGAVTVVIAATLEAALAASPNRPLVVVYPDFDNWNDYGRRYFARLLALGTAGERMDAQFRMMIDGELTTETALTAALAGNQVIPIGAIAAGFVCLFPDTEQYGELVQAIGFGPAISALRLLGDAVVVNIEQDDEDRLALLRTEDFHLGVLRHSGSYAAMRRGGRYFRLTPPAQVEDAARSFTFSVSLPSADNAYSVEFDFGEDPIFKDRTATLIGKNGTGKTQFLNSIVAFLSNNPPNIAQDPQAGFEPAVAFSRVLVFSSVPDDPFPKHIGAWHGIDYEHFPINSHDPAQGNGLLAALASCLRGDRGVHFGEDGDLGRLDLIKLALEPLGLWHRLHVPLTQKDDDDFPHLVHVAGQSYFPIRHGLNEQNSLRLIQRLDWDRMPVVLDENGNVRRLSSGETAMLRLAIQMAEAIEDGSLLLLDEPENHLHPNFVSQAMALLHQVLVATRSIAIIATHSAYVVREVPRQRVHILDLENRQISVRRPRLQTFGASIDTISQFVFGDTDIDHRYQAALEKFALTTGRAIGLDEVIATYGTSLNPESLSLIASTIQNADDD